MFGKKRKKELDIKDKNLKVKEIFLNEQTKEFESNKEHHNRNIKTFEKDQKVRLDSIDHEIKNRVDGFQKTIDILEEETRDGILKLYQSHNNLTSEEFNGLKDNIESLKVNVREVLNNEQQHILDDYNLKLESILTQKKEVEESFVDCRVNNENADNKYKDAESKISLYNDLEIKLKEEYESKDDILNNKLIQLETLKNKEYLDKNSELEGSYQELKRVIQGIKEEDIGTLESIYKGRIDYTNRHLEELGSEITLKSQSLNELNYIKDLYEDDPSALLKEKREKDNENTYLNDLLADKNIELDGYKNIAPTPEELVVKINHADAIRSSFDETFSKFNHYKERSNQFDDLQESLALSKARGKDIEEEIGLKKRENVDLKAENEVLSKKLRKEKIPREERIETIENPLVSIDNSGDDDCLIKCVDPDYNISEADFLDKIVNGIDKQGYKFDERLINAFHTSLKCADMAIISVLAGVSGTGKSTLGNLYSYYGGLIFNSTAVQPNWDSTEDLLGYYDSIGNSFNPTEVLRLLYQSQHSTKDFLHIILLDEMNLAHIELYFNQFLSKLEERRGKREGEYSYIDVNLGSGEKSLKLELRNNVFWLGTMNQDETVKNLSAKVIDRGNNLYFPSPDEFMDNIKPADKNDEATLLNKSNWDEWKLNRNELKLEKLNKLVDDKKKDFNEIHKVLVKLNKSLGHRGWQTIEMYLCNYPGVKSLALEIQKLEKQVIVEGEDEDEDEVNTIKDDNEKLQKLELLIDIAYEDIVAMKLFPKLNGADCSDDYKGDLEELKDLLPNRLHSDFDNAISNSYEIFQQVSSNYITCSRV